jgi:hypothetical protein
MDFPNNNNNNTLTTRTKKLKNSSKKKNRNNNSNKSKQKLTTSASNNEENLSFHPSTSISESSATLSSTTIKPPGPHKAKTREKKKLFARPPPGLYSTVEADGLSNNQTSVNPIPLRSASTKLKKQDRTMMVFLGKSGMSTTLESSARPLSMSKTSASTAAIALLSTSPSVLRTTGLIVGDLFPTKAVNRLSVDGSAPNEFSNGRSLNVTYLSRIFFSQKLNSFTYKKNFSIFKGY